MARKPQDDSNQRPLPLAEAEGSVAERRQKLAAALIALECDHLYAAFCFLIFDLTAGGARAVQLRREDLAWRPNRLCEMSTVRAALGRNRQLQLVAVRPSARDGLREANHYSIDWPMVDHWNGRPLPSVVSRPTSVVSRPTSVVSRPTSVVSRPTSVELEGGRGVEGDILDSCTDTEQENNPPPPPPGAWAPTSDATRQTAADEDLQAARSIAVSEAPAPLARPAPAAGRVSRKECRASWPQAERHLRLAGLRATFAAASEARQRGLLPDELIALIDHFRANAACWDGPGAIFHAIRSWLPGDDPAKPELWPTARKSNVGKWGV